MLIVRHSASILSIAPRPLVLGHVVKLHPWQPGFFVFSKKPHHSTPMLSSAVRFFRTSARADPSELTLAWVADIEKDLHPSLVFAGALYKKIFEIISISEYFTNSVINKIWSFALSFIAWSQEGKYSLFQIQRSPKPETSSPALEARVSTKWTTERASAGSRRRQCKFFITYI